MSAIYLLKDTRKILKKTVDGLTPDQLTRIPNGYSNHILWNLGHLAVSQQILNYHLAGLPMHVDEALCGLFRNGTSPRNWQTQPDIDVIMALLTDLPEKLVQDYTSGRFREFKGYQTRSGLNMQTIEDAVNYNNFHEGVHTGYVMAMKKLVV